MPEALTLPRTLPAKPTGFTKQLVCHINRGRDGASASFDCFAPDGTKLPIAYAYTTGRGHKLRTQGFYLPGNGEALTWAELAKRWPLYIKSLERLMASGLSQAAAIQRTAQPEPLPMVVIYDRPRDLPTGFVVRKWNVLPGKLAPAELLGADLGELELARALVPAGMVNIGRDERDDAKIVEVWV